MSLAGNVSARRLERAKGRHVPTSSALMTVGSQTSAKPVRHRVVSRRPLLARTEAHEKRGGPIADLMPRTLCDVIETAVQQDGSIRALIVDPVWMGWITLKTKSGVANLEKIMNAADSAPASASPAAGPAPAEALRMSVLVKLTLIGVEVSAELSVFSHVAPAGSSPPVDVSFTNAPPPAASDSETSCEWLDGTLVTLGGLSSAVELNGRSGVIVGLIDERGRYTVRLANDRRLRCKPEQLRAHPRQRQREAKRLAEEKANTALVLLGEDAKNARAGTYAVRIDTAKFWFDAALDRVLSAATEFEVLGLPLVFTDDLSNVRRQFRKISLSVHPDKNKHPQADAAFRKVYGAFEAISDLQQQRKLLDELSRRNAYGFTDEVHKDIQQAVDAAGAEDDDDDDVFEWWWDADVSEVDRAAEEAEGADMDQFAEAFVSADCLGGDINDVGWIGIRKALSLQRADRAVFLDTRERSEVAATGGIPGAFNVPMSEVMRHGIVPVLGPELIGHLLNAKAHSLLVAYSRVATPFSRCRAFCRFMLRAGHTTLPALRFRRLRGGIVGWQARGGSLAMPGTEGRAGSKPLLGFTMTPTRHAGLAEEVGEDVD